LLVRGALQRGRTAQGPMRLGIDSWAAGSRDEVAAKPCGAVLRSHWALRAVPVEAGILPRRRWMQCRSMTWASRRDISAAERFRGGASPRRLVVHARPGDLVAGRLRGSTASTSRHLTPAARAERSRTSRSADRRRDSARGRSTTSTCVSSGATADTKPRIRNRADTPPVLPAGAASTGSAGRGVPHLRSVRTSSASVWPETPARRRPRACRQIRGLRSVTDSVNHWWGTYARVSPPSSIPTPSADLLAARNGLADRLAAW
jgi:hypothetical protein